MSSFLHGQLPGQDSDDISTHLEDDSQHVLTFIGRCDVCDQPSDLEYYVTDGKKMNLDEVHWNCPTCCRAGFNPEIISWQDCHLNISFRVAGYPVQSLSSNCDRMPSPVTLSHLISDMKKLRTISVTASTWPFPPQRQPPQGPPQEPVHFSLQNEPRSRASPGAFGAVPCAAAERPQNILGLSDEVMAQSQFNRQSFGAERGMIIDAPHQTNRSLEPVQVAPQSEPQCRALPGPALDRSFPQRALPCAAAERSHGVHGLSDEAKAQSQVTRQSVGAHHGSGVDQPHQTHRAWCGWWETWPSQRS